jgi:ornithine cyclodeaminase
MTPPPMITILMPMLRVYSAAEVHAALSWDRLATAIAAAFVAGVQAPPRQAYALDERDVLFLMPAWNREALGVKLVTFMPDAVTHGAPTVQASYLLCDRATGAPRALIDGEALTLRRTAATSALAARHCARSGARTLLVVGTGRLAPWMARAHAALHPGIERVAVWGRRAAAADAIARELAAEGLPATAATDLESAVRGADIVSCATTAVEPIVRGQWLRAGTHLDLVGGFKPSMREVDDVAVARSRTVVDTYGGALGDSGELRHALDGGAITRAGIVAELAEDLRGEVRARTAPTDITLFKSVGAALEDLAAALVVAAG